MGWPEYFEISDQCRSTIVDQAQLVALEKHQIVQCGINYARDSFTIYRRNPNMHMLLFTCCGKGWLDTPSRKWQLIPNSVIYVPPGHENGFGIELDDNNTESWDVAWVMLASGGIWENTLPHDITYSDTRCADLLRKSIDCLHQSMSLPYPVGHELGENLVEQIRLLVSHRLPTSSPTSLQRLEKVFARAQEQFHRNWQVSELAALHPCSEAHFHRLCQQYYGHGPMSHLTRLRMEYAARLLSSTEWPIQHICELSGYPNPANFSTRFKKWSSLTPREFRQRFKY
ncbi:helix-turn-helix transcriptional regulator [Photobacterium chitinilyticum]|uniref:AraC family transcriptional regulator n=1 Tax=Photobacterium chitinilyticum TaxID=2485123 RepID=A0A444JWF1_9GAMM|nr:AraC family transcriptional regulator [Photobacterium chitinilyticum]RWX57386.1 AraC family transcriptional regulator [Photobacterium chitinilyticum]